MDAIHLSGNVWINCFYTQGKSGKTARVSVRSKGRGSFGTAVYIYVSYIYAKIFNCGLALIRRYMHFYMYVWHVFTFELYQR